MTKSRKGSLVA